MKRWILLIILLSLVLLCSLTVAYNTKQDEPKPLSFEEYKKIVGDKNKTILAYFHADWCVVCRRMQPTIDKITKEYGSQLEVLSIDTEFHKAVRDTFEIDGLPVMIFYKNGSLKWTYVGVISETELKKKMAYYVNMP
ncbi:MAG: thioredoxin family protein [Bacteroidota bacterium]